ncbi:biotin transporter BioY [Halorarius litoreus]|uniref:biotin transporter BioY n=1 Tax=Halorarius litoreus TaxID=2962676 RepID=UPI0020CD3E05|nr:biotin transporter BioY [Halorarius litoreus]
MSTETGNVDLVGDEVAGNLARTAVFAALMGAFAFVSFPFPLSPAPVTLQVLGVFLAGIMLGPLWGGAAMLLYLLAGILGAPVFAGGSAGLGTLFGATGGYLVSYPIAAFAIGAVVHGGLELGSYREAGLPRLLGGMVVGTVVIYALGVAGLYYVLGGSPDWTLTRAIVSGALVFLPAEAVKMAAALGIVRSDAITAE